MTVSRRICFMIIPLILFSTDAGAREWPDESSIVQEPFGAAQGDHFSRGLSFRSEGQRISAWSNGEVIWIAETENPPGTVPGEGLVVLEHSDGFRSSYRGIERRPDLKDRVSGGEWLGYAGNNAWVFEITDVERSRIVDPISLLPTRKDMSPVSIGQVEMMRGSNRLNISDGMELKPGRWIVIINDVFSDNSRAIPVEISLFWVGERIGSLRFDAIAETDEGIVMEIPDPRSYEFIYNSNGQVWFRDVLLNTGKGTLELRIRDETGRVITSSWSLSVR